MNWLHMRMPRESMRLLIEKRRAWHFVGLTFGNVFLGYMRVEK